MTRRMSCSMTIDAVKARTKTVTRRHVDTWQTLKPGDRLTLIEKGMGLPKGARQVVLADVEVIDVRVEPIVRVIARYGPAEMVAEGFPADTDRAEWYLWWCKSHGVDSRHAIGGRDPDGTLWCEIPCRRIEWRYLDG